MDRSRVAFRNALVFPACMYLSAHIRRLLSCRLSTHFSALNLRHCLCTITSFSARSCNPHSVLSVMDTFLHLHSLIIIVASLTLLCIAITCSCYGSVLHDSLDLPLVSELVPEPVSIQRAELYACIPGEPCQSNELPHTLTHAAARAEQCSSATSRCVFLNPPSTPSSTHFFDRL
jgi:hypothetical protein